MFERIQLDDGRAWWRSSLLHDLNVPHVFTTRSWNVKSADDVRGVIRATGLPVGNGEADPRIVMAKQVHGGVVNRPADRQVEADACVVDQAGDVAAVRAADCVPILLSSRKGVAVAAIHAGWRGLDPEVGVIGRAARVLTEVAGMQMDLPGRGLVAAVGPCVSGPRYEVGPEVADKFRARHGDAVLDGLGERPYLDVRAVARDQLIAVGVEADAMDVFDGCTHDDGAEFFSYRREGRGVGHQAAIVTIAS